MAETPVQFIQSNNPMKNKVMKYNRTKKYCSLAVATLLLGGALSASAATPTWNGTGADDNWTTGGNWIPLAPVAGNSLIFGGQNRPTPYNDFSAGTAFGGLTFSASATISFTLGGNAIELDGNLLNSSANPQEIDLAIAITNAVTFDTGGADVTVGGTISGAGSLTKLGTSSLILSNKTYAGGTTVSNGLLVVNNDNGNYTMSGGSLKLNYDSYWSGPTVAFTTNSSVGTDNGRIDFAGSIGTAGYTWTKTGLGTMNMVHWSADPTAVVKASSIDVAEGTLGCIVNGGTIAQWGSTNVPITVEVGAGLAVCDGNYAPNSIVLQGGDGGGRGALRSDRVNGAVNVTNTVGGTVRLNADSTIGTFGGIFVISGNITGPGALSTVGSLNGGYSQNMLVLAGTNTYGGNTTINTGVVQMASSRAIPGGSTNGNVQLNNTCTLDLNGFSLSFNALTDDTTGGATVDNSSSSPATLTFGGNDQPVSLAGPVKNTGGGPLSIVKIGSGGASLLGANTYSGSNVVSGGKLDIYIPTGTTTANGPVVVADGAEFSLRFRLAGSSIKATGATFGTSGATILDVDLGGFGNPSQPIINATNGTGVLSANGTINVNISGDGSVMSVGQFPLIKYASRTGTGIFVLGSLPANVTAQIVTNTTAKSIDLKVNSAPVTTWVGNVNNLWDINTANWSILGVGGKQYQDGVGVLFGDTALTNNVDLTTALSPSATLVNSTNDYTFGGAGSLLGGDLTKNGSGKLTLLTANNYNNTTIAGGTLQVDTNGTTATLGYGNVDVEGTLIFDRADNINIANTISGAGTVVQQDTNTLTLSAANTYSGGTLINQGRVQLGSATALGNPATGVAMATVASGAGLDINGKLVATANATRAAGAGLSATEGAVFNNGSGTCVGCGDVGINNLYLTGDTVVGGFGGDWVIGSSGNGITGNGYNLTKVGNNILYLRKSTVGIIGIFTLGAGGILIESANPFGTGTLVVITNNASLDSWGNNNGFQAYTIPNNILVADGGARIMNTRGHWWNTPDADTYTGTITLAADLTVQNSSARGTVLGVLTLSGPITGAGNVIKTGAYLVTLGGANTYTGSTTVGNGTLAVSAMSQGGGAYIVQDGAALDAPSQTSATTLPMSSLTLGAATGSTLSFSRVLNLTTNPVITATNLILAGNNIVSLPPGAYANPGQFPLIKFSGAITGGGTIALGVSGVRGLPGTIVTNVANSSIDVVIPAGNPVLWTGSAGNIWDIGTTADFQYLGSATTYQEPTAPGDAVTFDDTGANTTVNLSASVSPSLIVVSNVNKTYVFTNNVIAGTGGILKEGTGMLVLSNGANTFTGGATVSGGTLQLGNDGSLNNSSGTLTVTGSGAVDFNNWNPSALACTISGAGFNGNGTLIANYTNAATQKGPKTITLAGSATIGGSNRWDLRASGAAIITPTNAYTLTKVGANQISIVAAAVSPNLGDLKCLGGTLSFETTSTFGDATKTIYIGNGGGFGLYQNTTPVTKNIICSNGATIYALGGNVLSQNMIAGPIWVAEDGRATINANYNNTISISNVISGIGGIYVQWNSDAYFSATNTFKGDFETAGRTRLVGNASINPTNNITINNGGSGVLTVQDNAVVGGQNLRIWSGPATGALIVKNNGTINTKTIQVGNAFADWSGRSDGMLTLQSGQTFRIDNGGQVKGNIVAANNSTFSPGGGYYIQNTGYLTNNLSLQAGSTTFMDISMDGGLTNNDAVTVLGILTYGGTLQINRIGTNALAAGTTFKLFNFSTAPSGSFSSVTANTPGQFVNWDISQLSVNGTIRVASATSSSIPTITSGFSGGNLNLSWPADHLGWRLLVQTNHLDLGISTNYLDWGTVPGSAQTTSVPITIDPAKRTEFYRLVYP
jgi:autotransporter-associated beta strand protein